MKRSTIYLLYIYFAAAVMGIAGSLTSCSSDDTDDTTVNDQKKPEIVDGDLPNPIDCQQYHRGDVIAFRYTFTDNAELGNFNIEIHNNFDHHTHSTSAGDCTLDSKKNPVSPWVYNQDYPIPSGLKSYDAKVDITCPKDIDPGNYHFMVRVTDKSGWQQLKAVSIKILE